tara:strand:- start:555 stop:863 length:309 start_codon:yes stop_codon:yes gene_type:complete
MSHTFLSLDVELIPQETKDNVPTFCEGMFSNDKSRMLIDGRNPKGVIVHPLSTLKSWTQWSNNPDAIIQALIDSALEYTAEEIKAEQKNVNSIWYVDLAEAV